MERTCYFCPRKTQCYTPLGLAKLSPDDAPCGDSCGALFTTLDEASEFFARIGDAIREEKPAVQKRIFKAIAEKCGMPLYNIMIELED